MRPVECPGGFTDSIYHGMATGMCPSCDSLVALVSTGETARHHVQPTVTVSTDEATALALRLAARHVASDWLEWDDVPWLDEDSFERVQMAMDRPAAYLYAASRNFDERHDIDSADILSRAEA